MGVEAGRLAVGKFDMDEHRWRRFLVAMARVEETLDDLAAAHESAPRNAEPFAAFLARYPGEARSYEQSSEQLAELMSRAKDLVAFGTKWRARPRVRDGRIPRPTSELRITPEE